MSLDKRQLSYLWDMHEAAREIHSFMQGVKFNDFENNKTLRYAVERQLLVIGEAASHLPPQFRKQHPEIPWARIITMRNILAHEYGDTMISRAWLAATESVPELLPLLRKLLPE